MNTLTSPPITEMNVANAAHTLLAEWLRGWFNGSLHVVGANPPVLFPAVNIAFGQSDPVQPLYTTPGGLDAEIRVLTFARSASQESSDTALAAGKLATDYVLFNFWVSAKHPGAGQSAYQAGRVADLLKALLTNPDSRYPLVAGGITTLRPQLPVVIPATDYHKRLVGCAASLQYPLAFDTQPPTLAGLDLAAASGWVQSLEFFAAAPVVVGDYLLGHYTVAVGVTLQAALVIAWAPQTAPVVLQLEVAGALVAGTQVTLPAGDANTEATAALTLPPVAVAAGTLLRWKVISAPAVELSAWHLALELRVVPRG